MPPLHRGRSGGRESSTVLAREVFLQMMRSFFSRGRCIADRLLDLPRRSAFLKRRAETLCVERLESRELLSGNVEAFQIGSHLFLIGDSQANSLHLRERSGELVLEGTAGTTVNGSTERWVAAAAGRSLEGSLTVRLLGGSDSLLVQAGTRLGGSLAVFAGSGNDSVSVGSTTLSGSLLVAGAAGDDQVALRDVVIGGELLIDTSSGDDLVSLDDVQIGRSSRLWAGSGSDALVLDRVAAEGWAELFGGSGDDTLRVTEGRANRGWIASGGGGADLVSVVSTQTAGIALFVLGSGADGLQVDAASRAAGRVIAVGGSGRDQLQVPGETSVARPAILAGGDAGVVSASLIQQRLNDPTTGALCARPAQEILGGDADPPETLTLTLDTSDNETTHSQGVDVTADPSFQIEGTTAAGASVEIDADNDGQFDDAALTADSSGRFATTLTLRHDRTNRGDNLIRVRARDAQSRQATEAVRVHYTVGTVVRMQTDLGFVDLELLDDDAPNTVANFLGYLGRYAGTVIHRVQKATRDGIGVAQGGGFTVTVGRRRRSSPIRRWITNSTRQTSTFADRSPWPGRRGTSTAPRVSGLSTR